MQTWKSAYYRNMLRKIMVVEDEKLFAQLLSDALKSLPGVQVETVANGADALIALHHHRFDLIFTDIHMPWMNGIEFLTKLREEDSKVGIFVLTAHPQEGYIRSLNHLGIEDFLVKSECDLMYLRSIVEEYFHRLDIELLAE